MLALYILNQPFPAFRVFLGTGHIWRNERSASSAHTICVNKSAFSGQDTRDEMRRRGRRVVARTGVVERVGEGELGLDARVGVGVERLPEYLR